MLKKIIATSLVLSLAMGTAARADEWRHRHYGHHEHHHGGGDGVALALGLGLGAIALSEALAPSPVYVEPAPVYVGRRYVAPSYYAPPPPPSGPLVAIAGTRRDYPGYIAYQAQNGYGTVFECRQYDSGYRTCN